jgi:hypothetical protein
VKKRTALYVLIAGALGFAFACALARKSLKEQQTELVKLQALWLAEKSDLETALAVAHGRTITLPGTTRTVEVAKTVSPGEILERLKTMRVVANQPRSTRLLIHQFECLIEAGPAALPAIREFLARNEDKDYDPGSLGKSARDGRMPTEFNVPPSLRLGLFEVLKNIGSFDAEAVLVETLGTTGRGVEVAYLATVLETMSPGKYRDNALAAAHELLAHPLADAADKTDRNFLLATLAALHDPSFAAQAQAQLVQADGKVDGAALKYLQQTLPDKSLAIAMQAYQDPRVASALQRQSDAGDEHGCFLEIHSDVGHSAISETL